LVVEVEQVTHTSQVVVEQEVMFTILLLTLMQVHIQLLLVLVVRLIHLACHLLVDHKLR
jgi:hypothetical protein